MNPLLNALLVWGILSWRGGLMDWQAPLAALAALPAFWWTYRQPRLQLSQMELLLGGTVLIYAVLGFLGARPQWGLDEALVMAAVLLLALYWRREQGWAPAVAWAWLGLGTAASAGFFVAGLLQAPRWPTDSMGYLLRAHLSSRWIAPNQNLLAGCLSAPAMFLGLAFWCSGRRGRAGALALVAVLLGGAACVYAGSRGVWLASTVAGVGLAARWPRRDRWRFGACVLLLAFGLGLAARYAPFSSTRLRNDLQEDAHSADPNSARRLDFWAGSLRLSAERPWTGWGPGSYGQQAFRLDLPTPLDQKHPIARYRLTLEHAHNDWLELAVEAGWPLTIAALALVFGWLWGAWNRPDSSPAVLGLEAGIVVALVLSLTDMNLRTPGPFFGLALALAALAQGSRGALTRWSLPRWAPLVVAALVLVAMLGWWQRAVAQRELRDHQVVPRARLAAIGILQPLDGEAAAWRLEQGGVAWPWDAWTGRDEAAWCWAQSDRAGQMGDSREGLQWTQRALALHPFDAPGWLRFGQRLAAVGDRVGAVEVTEQALELEPNYCRAWSLLYDQAGLNHDRGRQAIALASIKRARSLKVLEESVDPYSQSLIDLDPSWMALHLHE